MSKICKKRVHRNGGTTLPWAFKYYVYDSNVKYCDLKDFLKDQFTIFRCQKYVKKGTWKWGKNFTLSPEKVSYVALFYTTNSDLGPNKCDHDLAFILCTVWEFPS